MQFSLDPQSGYANSYTDIKFKVKFDLSPMTEIRLFNETNKSQLEILSVMQGYIKDENIAVVHETNQIEGFINLFNRDKMNESLANLPSVEIKCEVKRYIKPEVPILEEAIVNFYNLGKSVDCNIIPFDLNVENNNLNLAKHEALKLHITADQEKRYEICIKSKHGSQICTIEFVTRPGSTPLIIPAELLWYDLGLSKYKTPESIPEYMIYWVKFEGVTYQKIMNRQYVPIDGTALRFVSNNLMPRRINRQGPTGKDLPNDKFVLSHRYFVITHQAYSQYAGYTEGYKPWRQNRLTMFMHEAQDMQAQRAGQDGNNVQMTMLREQRDKKKTVRSSVPRYKRELLGAVKDQFTQQAIGAVSTNIEFYSSKEGQAIAPTTKKKSGCGCSRKRNA